MLDSGASKTKVWQNCQTEQEQQNKRFSELSKKLC